MSPLSWVLLMPIAAVAVFLTASAAVRANMDIEPDRRVVAAFIAWSGLMVACAVVLRLGL